MKKFRPGDVVNILTEPDGSATGIVVDVFHDDSGEEYVSLWASYIDDNGDVDECFNDYKASEVELIPHPDTIRLNELELRLFEKDEVACNIYYDGHLNAFVVNDGLHQYSFDSFRAAVDFILDEEEL